MPQRNALTINSPSDVESNYQNALAAQYQARNAQQVNQENQLKLNEMGQQDKDRQAVIGAWQSANGDRNVFLQNLQKTAPHLVQDMRTKMAMSDIELQKAQLGQATQLIDATAQRVGALKAIDPTQRPLAWGAVRQQLLQMGHSPQELPEQYPGDQWVDMTLQQGLDAKAQVEAAQKKQADETTRRGQDMTAQTARRGQDITMRGQNMTDARARESQATSNDLRDLKAKELSMQIQQQQSSAEGAKASYDRAIQSLDSLYKVEKDASGKIVKETVHPGLSAAVGAGWGMLGIPALPGTDRADFEAQLDTLKAQTFLPMVQSLKGMGALSDAEGKKLTDAIGALSTKQKETTFKQSVLNIRQQLEEAKARVPNFGGQQQPAAPQGLSNIHVNPQTGEKIGWDGKQWVKF